VLVESQSPLARLNELNSGDVFRVPHQDIGNVYMTVFDDSVTTDLKWNAVNLKTGELHVFDSSISVEKLHAVLHIR
jgi:hypothetical protein